MLLLAGILFGGSYLFLTRTAFLLDQGLKYAYPQMRPYVERSLPDEWPPPQKEAIMNRIDRDVDGYLSLPSGDRRAVREKIKEMATTWSNPQIDKEVQLREIEALIQELKNKESP